jgi:hypothetical protein
LKNFEIYLHQLTPNASVRLSVYIWDLRSQGMSPNAQAFYQVHELHYQTKARADGLHENFGCYNFAYRKDIKAPVLSYRTKWPTGWKCEWFYMKVDEKKREKLMSMVMSPLTSSFGMTRPLCHMQLGSPCQVAEVEFRVVAAEVGTRDLVQEFLANRVFLTSSGWGMTKKKDVSKKHELVRLPYRFKFQKEFKKPCQEWLEMIETMCNEILGNYTKKEDQLMTVAFGTRPKRRLNRVMDAIDFEYPDYERFDNGVEGLKRKRIVNILNRQAARLVKEDEKISKKTKSTPEPKPVVSKKRKPERKPEVPKSKVAEAREGTPTPSTAEAAEILKVMTESLAIQLLSPLRPELMKLLQKKDQPSAIKEKIGGQKRRIIVNVMHAIERTPSPALASRMMHVASTDAETTAEAETIAEAATAAEAANLMSPMSGIDKLISDMVAEEAVATVEEIMAAVPDKDKEVADTSSKGKEFDLRHLGDQELSKAEKDELEEYAKSCGYQPGSMLFGGVDEEILGCIRDRGRAKIIGTLSKSVSFPKLESNTSGYRWQHIIDNLFYSNFMVKFFCLDFCYLCNELKFSEVSLFSQSMLLSKALRMQQDLEDKKNEIIIEGLDSKIKDCKLLLKRRTSCFKQRRVPLWSFKLKMLG